MNWINQGWRWLWTPIIVGLLIILIFAIIVGYGLESANKFMSEMRRSCELD